MGSPATDNDGPKTGSDHVADAHAQIAANAAARGETTPGTDETKIAEELEKQADADADAAEIEPAEPTDEQL